jgi:hypothetical protein
MCTICGNIAGDADEHLRKYSHTPVTAGVAPESDDHAGHQH